MCCWIRYRLWVAYLSPVDVEVARSEIIQPSHGGTVVFAELAELAELNKPVRRISRGMPRCMLYDIRWDEKVDVGIVGDTFSTR